MDTLSAPLEVHVNVLAPPCVMGFGSAEMLTVGSSLTVTVTLSVLDPYVFVAVIVYVVVTLGVTLVDPFTSTGPIPWSMLTLSAAVEVHVRVDVDPALIAEGSAEILTVGSVFTVTVTLLVTDPNVFVAVTVYVVVALGVTLVVPLSATDPIP